MEIEIPSPSVFLRQDDVLPAGVPGPLKAAEDTWETVPKRSCPNERSKTMRSNVSAQQNGDATGLKQSKSRNGCITCKRKRLKCDETKPICAQCKKRNTECGGYKKNYKWRAFEDVIKQSRAGKARKRPDRAAQGGTPRLDSIRSVGQLASSSYSNEEPSWSPSLLDVYTSATPAIAGVLSPTDSGHLTDPLLFNPFQFDPLQFLDSNFSLSCDDFSSRSPAPRSQPARSHESGGRSSFSTCLPPSVNILMPGTDLGNAPEPSVLRHPWSLLTDEQGLDEISLLDDEDISGETGRDQTATFMPDVSGYLGMLKSASPADPNPKSSTYSQSTSLGMMKAPSFDPSSPEMLVLRFHQDTCGILSIKDGPSENPWRTLIWPLAKDSQALYHAILAMTALHGGTTQPQLKLAGIVHMTKSISKLSAEMHKMSLDQILASALTLTLSESWDDRISTGMKHLKGAKTLLNKALAQRRKSLQFGPLGRENAKPLKFLSNIYAYLVAIARLTSNEEPDDIDLDGILRAVNEPVGGFEMEIDPLMGCATTLFPLLGKVGSLIQKVRRTPTNSLGIISEANELREQLLQWEPPDIDLFKQPEDLSCDPRHALHTAEAYRRAILLCLHSAVTELSSEPSYDQAKGILTMLASTPLSSRTVIVQIFPLLVGSCEMVDPDDRLWVAQRWDAMMKRLTIVNVSSCWKTVREVWRRRDQWVEIQAQRAKPMMGQVPKRKTGGLDIVAEDAFLDTFPEGGYTGHSCQGRGHRSILTSDTPGSVAQSRPLVRPPRRHTDIDVSLRNGEIQYTVRGHLHWLGVMSDWSWEVFL